MPIKMEAVLPKLPLQLYY